MVSRTDTGLGVQSLALAVGAAHRPHVLFQLEQMDAALAVAILATANSGMIPSNVPPYFMGDDAAAPGEGDVFVAGAPQPQVVAGSVGSSSQGVSSMVPAGELRARARPCRPRPDRCAAASGPSSCHVPSQFEAALLERQSVRSGISSSGSNEYASPSPSHSRHMPCGLLKLNSCGLGGSKLMPQCVQA